LSSRPELGKSNLKKQNAKIKKLGAWLKWYTACLLCASPCTQSALPHKKKVKNMRKIFILLSGKKTKTDYKNV
jgi:hypothetical protein